MPKKLITLVLLVLTTVSLHAQTVCKGTVVNLNKDPVTNASVLIKDTNDNILQFGFTNAQGAFSITTENQGSFVVEVNKMDFVKQQQPLNITNDKKNTRLHLS